MNITPRIKSARNRNNLIVNVSIEIPLKGKLPVSHRSQETSLSPSPNKLRKRFKLISSAVADKRTLHSSNVITVREGPATSDPAPSRKKTSNPTPSTTAHPSAKGNLAKFRSCQLSPKRRAAGKKGRAKIRNISILEQVMGEDDIIKYTSNSNELRDKAEDLLLLENLGRKIDTHVSEIDLNEVRRMQNSARDSRERVCLRRVQDMLRTACAKKIQRAWRNYKTKKLIRSYSNDIRNKYLRSMHISDDPPSTRSQGTGFRFKKKLLSYDEIVANQPDPQQRVQAEAEVETDRSGRSSRIVKKIQEDNMEKWEGLIEQIKNKKNLTAALEFSIERSKELKQELNPDFFRAQPDPAPSPPPASPPPSPPSSERKIIKTKKYYEGEREKWRESIERSTGSIQREQRVNYFENEMMRLENDYSESGDSSLSHSMDLEGNKQQEEIENFKLRKKLEVFRNHLPEVQPFHPQQQNPQPLPHTHTPSHTQTNRIDIATIIRKKNESQEKPHQQQQEESRETVVRPLLPKSKSIEVIEFDLLQDAIEKSPSSSSSQSLIDTHRDWRPLLNLEERQEDEAWRDRLASAIRQQETELHQLVLEQLILQSLIEVSESERLIAFIKAIHDRTKGGAIGKKAEGIVTNHSSIRDYISYFINYLYEYKVDGQVLKNLHRPLGPSPKDVLRYFRGEEIAYDPDSEYVMGIRIFNAHWDYANELIYFDRKWDDEARETERVSYLKQLTKVFFRAIFDCFNESLEGLRIYGQRGKPYPWSVQRLCVEPPELKKSLTVAFQRVVRYSLVFSGVLFQDKHHSLDERSMEDIQQANMVKLITLELHDDEPLWLFLEDELAEIKLELAQHVEQALLAEIAKIIAVRSGPK